MEVKRRNEAATVGKVFQGAVVRCLIIQKTLTSDSIGLARGGIQGSDEKGTQSLELIREAQAEHIMKTTAVFLQLSTLLVWIMYWISPWRTLCPWPLYGLIDAVCVLTWRAKLSHQLLSIFQCCPLMEQDQFSQLGSSHRPWCWRVTCWRHLWE